MENIKHIVQFSGGKDSTCMLLMMLEKGMPVDEIIFCDTGMEFPQMYEHIEQVRKYISKYGKEVTILKAENTFEHMMFDYVKTKGKRQGQKGNGWATMLVRWCTSYLKQEVQKKHTKGMDFTSYIGIAYDEPKRHEKIKENQRHPLFDWHITESQALSFCVLYHKYPALWEKLKDMDNRAWNQFRADYSVQQLEEKFKREDYLKKTSIPLFDVSKYLG